MVASWANLMDLASKSKTISWGVQNAGSQPLTGNSSLISNSSQSHYGSEVSATGAGTQIASQITWSRKMSGGLKKIDAYTLQDFKDAVTEIEKTDCATNTGIEYCEEIMQQLMRIAWVALESDLAKPYETRLEQVAGVLGWVLRIGMRMVAKRTEFSAGGGEDFLQ